MTALYGTWPKLDPAALRVELYFEIKCEEFERTLPGFWSVNDPDCWIPMRGVDGVIRHANELRSRIRDYLRRGGFSGDNREARRYVERMTYSAQVKLAAELDASVGSVFTLDPPATFEPKKGFEIP
jgi:hypothetical protein